MSAQYLCFPCSIYEKLIQFCAIDELGTNYPKVCPLSRDLEVEGITGPRASSTRVATEPVNGTATVAEDSQSHLSLMPFLK